MTDRPFVPIPPEPTKEMIRAALPTLKEVCSLDHLQAVEVYRVVYDFITATAPPAPGIRLTDNQHAVLTAFCELQEKKRRPPSHREVAERVGLSRPYTSDIIRRLAALRFLKPSPKRETATGSLRHSRKFGYMASIRADPYRETVSKPPNQRKKQP